VSIKEVACVKARGKKGKNDDGYKISATVACVEVRERENLWSDYYCEPSQPFPLFFLFLHKPELPPFLPITITTIPATQPSRKASGLLRHFWKKSDRKVIKEKKPPSHNEKKGI
jgi:hypothetical protein